MLTFILFNLLLLSLPSIWASNEEHLSNDWIPIAKPDMYYQTNRNYIDNKYDSVWKPSEDIDNNNIDIFKADAIQLITPQQAESIQNEINALASVPVIDSTEIPIFKIAIKEKYGHKIITSTEFGDDLRKQHFTMKPQRESKYLRSRSSTNDNISAAPNKSASNIEPAETKVSIKAKNITSNNYEVTEPTNNQEVIQKSNDENGYIYQQPLVSSGLTVSQNQYTKKFVQLLSKYNIKVHDMLNNYAQSKMHHNNILNVHPYHVPSVPFRYNSLNHHPVDPLLAVLLSNYGYYLQGFYGLPNNYRNLYGYSASNNIHNNKPFGSYKIFSDTDSSN